MQSSFLPAGKRAWRAGPAINEATASIPFVCPRLPSAAKR